MTAGAALALAFIPMHFRETQRYAGAISDWVAAAESLPEREPILTFVRTAYPAGGRVNLIHHASAYFAMRRAVAYPEVFAKDPRVHRSVLRPEARERLFGLEPELPWRDFVDLDRRAAWFETHPGTIAVAFEPTPALERRLRAASAETLPINPRVVVFIGRANAPP